VFAIVLGLFFIIVRYSFHEEFLEVKDMHYRIWSF